jgi:hypothetical protein
MRLTRREAEQPIRSPDGKMEAKPVQEPTPKDSHYQVREISTDKVIFTTYSQYPTPNDVKAGLFSPDSKQFAAAYHYAQAGNYTWIGVWSVDSSRGWRISKDKSSKKIDAIVALVLRFINNSRVG